MPDGLAPSRTASETPAAPATGSLLSGFVADTEEVTEALAKGVTTAIDLGASILLGAAVALLLAPTAGAALLAGAAGGIALAMLVARLGRSAATRTSAIRADLADQVVETMRSAPELLAFGRADLIDERLEQVRRRGRSAALRQSLVTGILRTLTTWAAGAGLLGVVLAGLSAHRGGRLSGIMLTVLVLVALAALDQASALPAALAGRTAGDAAATRLAQLSALEAPVREPAVDAGPALGPVGAALEHVDVVAHGGPPGPPLLSDVSLAVRPGWRLGLVGPSGAGKSSALHVLLHFLEPSAGTASIGGVDVRRMTRTGMARHLAWLAEETHLFAAPLGDNLRLARPGGERPRLRRGPRPGRARRLVPVAARTGWEQSSAPGGRARQRGRAPAPRDGPGRALRRLAAAARRADLAPRPVVVVPGARRAPGSGRVAHDRGGEP